MLPNLLEVGGSAGLMAHPSVLRRAFLLHTFAFLLDTRRDAVRNKAKDVQETEGVRNKREKEREREMIHKGKL